MPKFVTALFAVSLLAGCGGTMSIQQVQPAQVFQRYSLHYDVKNAKTAVQAEFLVESTSGIPLELTGSAKVSDNGKPLVRPADFAPIYTLVENALVLKHELVLTHVDGTTETHAAEITPIAPHVIDPDKPETIPPKQDFWIFHWTGAPVGKDETVYAIFENDTGVKTETVNLVDGKWTVEKATTRTARYVSTSTEGDVSLRLEKKDLDAIGNGKRSVKFQRVRRTTIGDPKKPRGTISASYVSEPMDLVFEKAPGEKDRPLDVKPSPDPRSLLDRRDLVKPR